MRKYLLLTICLLMATSVFAKTYTIDSYLMDVKQYNNDLKIAEKDKDIATARKRQAWAGALPNIGMEASYNNNISEYYMYMDLSAMMPGAGTIKAPAKRNHEYSTTLALQQTLFSPTVGLGIKAAKQYANLAENVYQANLQGIATGAKKVFYQCLLLEKVFEVTEASENNAHENYLSMVDQFDNGQISQFELLQAETRWRNAIPEKLKAERNLQLVMNTLKNLAGMDISEEITLEGSLESTPDLPQRPEIRMVFENRPDFQALNWEEKLRKTNAVASRGFNQIRLTGTMAYILSGQSEIMAIDEENKFLTAGVNLSIPIFTGGYLRAKEQENIIELDKTRVNISKHQDDISKNVENIYLRLVEAQKRIESAETTLATAEKAFSIAETTSRDGLTTQLQLKDARIGYDQAQINYYAAIFDFLAAYFDWEQALGIAEL